MDEIISHLRQLPDMTWQFQPNDEHQQGVANLAELFAASFNMAEWGRALGLLHDKGKEKHQFQDYIRNVSGFDTTRKDYDAISRRHAYVGALLAKSNIQPPLYILISQPIAGHHAGLQDPGDFHNSMALPLPADVDPNVDVHLLPASLPKGLRPDDFNHLVRMLFSCLVDADFLDTERFMSPDSFSLRGGGQSCASLADKLRQHMDALAAHAKPTPVNAFRATILEACRDAAPLPQGFFSLTVPTGGGKTLASLSWALEHAIAHGLSRVIIAIPFTSIVSQTAAVLRSIFGDENVLEHHSAASADDEADDAIDSLKSKARLASENWDAPIVVTTNVQLLESLYANKPSKCRKLHNIARSVVILDEAQALPLSLLQPIVNALKSYQRLFGVSFLLMTASQPILGGNSLQRLKKECQRVKLNGLDDMREISPDPDGLALPRRTQIVFDYERPWDYDELASRMLANDRILCVVNTREVALEVFRRVAVDPDAATFHLSRMMCGEHIQATLAQIRCLLTEQPHKKVRVISTQLIEAGVDLDFPAVFRQVAGLDSILQAAGRCNREGLRQEKGVVTVFSLPKPKVPRGALLDAVNALKGMRAVLGSEADVMTQAAMTEFFGQLYARFSRDHSFDKEAVEAEVKNIPDVQFATAAKKFRLIDDDGVDILVPYLNGEALIEQLRREGPSRWLMRKLRPYAVSVGRHLLDGLLKERVVEQLCDGLYCLTSPNQYDAQTGLLTTNVALEELMMV